MKKESPPPTLCEIGISNDQSSRWQQLASMSEEHFEAAVATAKDTAGQVTTAFMLREAGKSRPAKRLTKADKERLERLNQSRTDSLVVMHARQLLTALRSRDSFTDEEKSTLEELAREIENVSATA